MSISPEKREVLAAAAQAAAEATIKKWFKMPENDKDIIRRKWKTINFITEIKIMKMNDDFIESRLSDDFDFRDHLSKPE